MKSDAPTGPGEDTTRKAASRCSHRDMAGDSAIEALNDHTWCTICGAAGPELVPERGTT